MTRKLALIVALLILTVTSFQQTQVSKVPEGLAAKNIGTFKSNSRNVGLTLRSLALKHEIPIGFEVSPFDNVHTADKSIDILIADATVGQVLDEIIRQNSLYTWEERGGVIKVIPTTYKRDEKIIVLMELRLTNVFIRPGMSLFDFRKSIASYMSFEKFLDEQDLIYEPEAFGRSDFSKLGSNFSLDISELTVEELLDAVIRESDQKFWIVSRYGNKDECLLINF